MLYYRVGIIFKIEADYMYRLYSYCVQSLLH